MMRPVPVRESKKLGEFVLYTVDWHLVKAIPMNRPHESCHPLIVREFPDKEHDCLHLSTSEM